MKLVALCVLALLATVLAHGDHSHSHDHAHDGDSDVLVLDSTNFDQEILAHDITLVEFYAPWCGHCKSLAPQYEEAATSLRNEVALAKVDCTIEKDLCSRFSVQGFPTLKIFRKSVSTPSEYAGPRQATGIVDFMRRQTQPAFRVVKDAAEVEAFAASNPVAIVGFFASEDSEEAQNFKQVAETHRNDYSFALSADAQLASANGASVNSVVMFKNFDEPKVVHSGDLSVAGVEKFIKAESFPLVGEIGPENYQSYLARGLPLVWIFVDLTADVTKDVLETVGQVAAAFKGQFSFVKLDGIRWVEHAKHFGLTGATPGIVLEDRVKNKNFVFPQDSPVTEEALSAHINGYLDGSLKPLVKSEPIPESNDAPVTVLVGKNFESIVFDQSKDVFVEFYAPWCGHCKTLAPKWDQLGEQFKSVDSVVIAKVDATANDTPASIKGFPTLLFYPANAKETPLTYSGERNTEALAAFVRANAVTLQSGDSTKSAEHTHEEL